MTESPVIEIETGFSFGGQVTIVEDPIAKLLEERTLSDDEEPSPHHQMVVKGAGLPRGGCSRREGRFGMGLGSGRHDPDADYDGAAPDPWHHPHRADRGAGDEP